MLLSSYLSRRLEVRRLEVRRLEVRRLEVRRLEVRRLEVRQREVRRHAVLPGRALLGMVLLCGALLAAAGCGPGEPSATASEAQGDAQDSARRGAAAGSSASARTGAGARRAGRSPSAAGDPLTVVVFGNSLSAGYGLSKDEAFPALLQQKADSAGLGRVNVVNAGNSGETTAGGRRRIDWVLSQRDDLDVLVLELGGNDALRGLSPDSARANLQAIIRKTHRAFPEARVVLAGMKAPPNMGGSYTQRFEHVYPYLAEQTGATLVPFLLEGVAGDPSLNQSDGIHPTAEGQRVVARNVWDTLGPLLREMRPGAVPG